MLMRDYVRAMNLLDIVFALPFLGVELDDGSIDGDVAEWSEHFLILDVDAVMAARDDQLDELIDAYKHTTTQPHSHTTTQPNTCTRAAPTVCYTLYCRVLAHSPLGSIITWFGGMMRESGVKIALMVAESRLL